MELSQVAWPAGAVDDMNSARIAIRISTRKVGDTPRRTAAGRSTANLHVHMDAEPVTGGGGEERQHDGEQDRPRLGPGGGAVEHIAREHSPRDHRGNQHQRHAREPHADEIGDVHGLAIGSGHCSHVIVVSVSPRTPSLPCKGRVGRRSVSEGGRGGVTCVGPHPARLRSPPSPKRGRDKVTSSLRCA